ARALRRAGAEAGAARAEKLGEVAARPGGEGRVRKGRAAEDAGRPDRTGTVHGERRRGPVEPLAADRPLPPGDGPPREPPGPVPAPLPAHRGGVARLPDGPAVILIESSARGASGLLSSSHASTFTGFSRRSRSNRATATSRPAASHAATSCSDVRS